LVDGILQVSGVPAHAYWERRGQLLGGFESSEVFILFLLWKVIKIDFYLVI